MKKTILLTGGTDGIGLETAKMLISLGHTVLLHGRSQEKLEVLSRELSANEAGGGVATYMADLSRMVEVGQLAEAVVKDHTQLDVLINNAGVYNSPVTTTEDGLDVRFAVNTIAPYLLTKRLLPLLDASGRVVNVSSAAQFPVDPQMLAGKGELSDGAAYAQSKLALTMWSRTLAAELTNNGPAIIAVNPRSLLGSKMVRQAYGVVGADLRIGADILCRAALSDEFGAASGRYYDNDTEQFASPHPDALDPHKCQRLTDLIESILAQINH